MENHEIFFFSIILFVGLAGFVGNLVVIIVYLYDKSMRRSFVSKCFFVNLSLVDILIILVALPVGLMDLVYAGVWHLGEFFCKMQHFIESMLVCVSALTLIFIGVERYLAITQPFKVMNILNKKLCLSILCSIWFVSFLLTVPLIKYNKYSRDMVNIEAADNNSTQNNTNHSVSDSSNRYVEYCYNDRSSTLAKIYVSAFPALVLFLPAFTLTVLYVFIIKKLKKHNEGVYEYEQPRQDPANVESNESTSCRAGGFSRLSARFLTKKNSSTTTTATASGEGSAEAGTSLLKRKKTNERISLKMSYDQSLVIKRNQTITLCLVSLAFFFCQMPIKAFQIFNSFYVFDHNSFTFFRVMNVVFFLSKFLFFLHGMSNPIIYNLMSVRFRTSFRNVILCQPINNKPKANAQPTASNNGAPTLIMSRVTPPNQ